MEEEFLILFSQDIMHLFGAEYISGAEALIIIVLGQVVNAATGSVGLINNMTGIQSMRFILAY